MHTLLEKQIRRSTEEGDRVDLAKLYDYVSAAYEELDQDRQRIDRAHWLMAEELDAVNRNLETVVDGVRLGDDVLVAMLLSRIGSDSGGNGDGLSGRCG